MSADAWAVPTSFPPLTPGTVQVWRVFLETSGERLSVADDLLSPDERARAARFRRPQDARRFCRARVALRVILGQALGEDPAGLRFDYGPQGKPVLATDSSLAFNVSHSGELALVALCLGGEVGVDIERVRDDFSGDAIAERFFCAAELSWLRGLPADRRQDGFFRLWTRKEAFLKARGEGIWHELDRFDVSPSPPQPIVVPGAEETLWYVHDLDPGGGCRAALAVEGCINDITTWQWGP